MASLNTTEMVLVGIASFLSLLLFVLIIYFFFIKKSTPTFQSNYQPQPVTIQTPVVQRNTPITSREILDAYVNLNNSDKLSVAKSINSFIGSSNNNQPKFEMPNFVPVERTQQPIPDPSFYGDNLER